MDQERKTLYSPTEAAGLLGVSRVAVFKRIQSGKIHAERVGSRYVIPASEITEMVSRALTDREKRQIEAGVKRVANEYGETLKLLGQE